ALGAGAADRLHRDAGAGCDLLALERVQLGDDAIRVGRPGLVLDAGVEVFGVLAHDHEIDAVVPGPDARVRLAGAEAGVEAELVPERDVDRPEARSDRRRDRSFDGDLVRLDRRERLFRQRRPRRLHHLDAGLADVPFEVHAGRFENPARGLRELGAGAVAGDEGDAVRHAARQRTHARCARLLLYAARRV